MQDTKQYASDACHDYFHFIRVYQNAATISQKLSLSPEDKFVVGAGALLHDIGRNKQKDFRKTDHHEKTSAALARNLLKAYAVPDALIAKVEKCILDHKTTEAKRFDDVLAQIVYDADKLDSLGAIAIARAFAYDSSRPLYLPDDTPKDVYDGVSNSSLNHLIEKVLRLTPDKFYTAPAQVIAKSRLEFVKEYVAEFLSEWNGEQ